MMRNFVGPVGAKARALTVVPLLFFALAGTAACQRAGAEDQTVSSAGPAALTAAVLTDQDGQTRSFGDFSGKTLVFGFFFTSCPVVCPRETQALSEVQQRLPAALRERVRFISFSVDPENDTPEAMRKFARANGADLLSWSFVRASGPATRAVTQELTAFQGPAKALAEPSAHTTAVYLFDGSGRLMQRYAGSPLDVSRLVREVEQLDVWLRKKKET